MCTVTLIARRNGYALGMNRDEKLARIQGLPPARRVVGGRQIFSPAEPGGGTWIALNDSGAACALINWYTITARVNKNPVSRGTVVNAVSVADSTTEAARLLSALPLKQINPFRLITVYPSTMEIVEWRWDLKSLSKHVCEWKTQQWISSGFDELAARRIRNQTFQHALKQKTAGRIGWLLRLHRSHAPEAGPFSTCMHRSDAATVSYTEVTVSLRTAAIRYVDGPPCRWAQPVRMWQIRANRQSVDARYST